MKLFLVVCAILILGGCQVRKDINATVDATTGLNAISQGQAAERDLAIAQAKIIFQQKTALGEDLSAGPCLAENLLADWVADIAHNPRVDTDNQPANQCQNFRSGKARHFVELDPQGNLLRAE